MDFAREKWDVFHQAWEYLNDNFYDPKFHGTDWNAVHTAYAPLIAGSKTPDEMRRVLSLMIGEMNASHMGISAPPAPNLPTAQTGKLGLEFDRGGLRAARPAAHHRRRPQRGRGAHGEHQARRLRARGGRRADRA